MSIATQNRNSKVASVFFLTNNLNKTNTSQLVVFSVHLIGHQRKSFSGEKKWTFHVWPKLAVPGGHRSERRIEEIDESISTETREPVRRRIDGPVRSANSDRLIRPVSDPESMRTCCKRNKHTNTTQPNESSIIVVMCGDGPLDKAR